MLKRFVWKENDVYSVQLTGELYILAQLLTKPYAAFFNIRSASADFSDAVDIRQAAPLGVCMVLKDFFKKCAVHKMPVSTGYRQEIAIPELFISPDREQWFQRSDIDEAEQIYNLVRIDPVAGDQGIMGNEIVLSDIIRNHPELLHTYELVGYNTGYELIRRLLLSVEQNRWIDPAREKLLVGQDLYPLQTLDELWHIGVPRYV
ncbi:hypothetical protein [Paenibacillus bovis]|uniref:Uncharacterized protein n=1 Tax=Paenibacillus bovis TaxID=1616788 RepID=A0A172ZKN9_9BACL|nr:hypothetical protein [Paenibacillus bovis]ANF98109.1 hypothetical protein AR543_20255 [Paenibacillus bovis]